jgi:outer membrane protein OmpA-like peptidoglycan-associated protein
VFSIALIALATSAIAGDHFVEASPLLPTRPTTHPLDDRLSVGRVENFVELYVSPDKAADDLRPFRPGKPGRGAKSGEMLSLPINNETSSYAEISVNGVKIGVLESLTNGAIHGVKPGVYKVSFLLQNGYEETREIQTIKLEEPIIPGGKGVQKALESGYVPTWAERPHLGYVEIVEVAPPPPPRVRLVGQRIEINEKVMFALNSAEIDAVSHNLLDEVAGILVANPQVELIEVQGHTDNRGDPEHNRKLSQSRAEAVASYLTSKGVDAARLVAKGLGPDVPLHAEETEEAWSHNRRVEFHVLREKPRLIELKEGEAPPPGAVPLPAPELPKGGAPKP